MKPENTKNLVETSVPNPPVQNLSEAEKKALELSEQMAHSDGPEHKALSEAAAKLGGQKPPSK